MAQRMTWIRALLFGLIALACLSLSTVLGPEPLCAQGAGICPGCIEQLNMICIQQDGDPCADQKNG